MKNCACHLPSRDRIFSFRFSDCWADFEKHHEFNTTLLLGIIWMLQRLFRAPKQSVTKFVLACGLSVTAAVAINTQSGLYFGAVFAFWPRP